MQVRLWMEGTNEVLLLGSLPKIPSAAAFDDEANLTPEQLKAKYLIRLGQMAESPRMVAEFLKRRLPLPFQAGVSTYDLDPGINPGTLKFGSFFDVTAGGNGFELKAWDYNDYKRMYPDASIVPTGKPHNYILVPPEREEVDPNWRVILFPTPDADGDAQYIARINPTALVDSTSYLTWPFDYEYALWMWAWYLMEQDLGEGKEGVIMALANKAFKDIKIANFASDAQRKTVRVMGKLFRARRPRTYDSRD